MRNHLSLLLCILALGVVLGEAAGNLQENFYQHSCPLAEEIIQKATEKHVIANPNAVPARLLRLHFHDCFVRGCDASVLLNSTRNNAAEKTANPNLTLRSFEVIDDIKKEVEAKCPGIVSCADILALSARDSVSFQYKKPLWKVLTGRRDGTVSRASEALANLPPLTSNFTVLKENFASKGLSVDDLVILSGAHTIGVGHCNSFSNRLYNFTGKGDQDPSLGPTYATFLKTQCKSLTDISTFVPLDPNSPAKFDTLYYATVESGRGLLESDAALLNDKVAKDTVHELLETAKFFTEFAKSMMKMGAIEVLTGTEGQIRKHCAFVN